VRAWYTRLQPLRILLCRPPVHRLLYQVQYGGSWVGPPLGKTTPDPKADPFFCRGSALSVSATSHRRGITFLFRMLGAHTSFFFKTVFRDHGVFPLGASPGVPNALGWSPAAPMRAHSVPLLMKHVSPFLRPQTSFSPPSVPDWQMGVLLPCQSFGHGPPFYSQITIPLPPPLGSMRLLSQLSMCPSTSSGFGCGSLRSDMRLHTFACCISYRPTPRPHRRRPLPLGCRHSHMGVFFSPHFTPRFPPPPRTTRASHV